LPEHLRLKGIDLFTTPPLDFFLRNKITLLDFESSNEIIDNFSKLDDYDIFTSMKIWSSHPDKILSSLSNSIVNRRLFKIEMQNEPFNAKYIDDVRKEAMKTLSLSEDEIDYFVISDSTSNYTYKAGADSIGILYKDRSVVDIAEASDQLNISLLSVPTTKYFLCYPKSIN